MGLAPEACPTNCVVFEHPDALGLVARLAEAVAYAQAHENPAPRDQALYLAQSFGKNEPYFGGRGRSERYEYQGDFRIVEAARLAALYAGL